MPGPRDADGSRHGSSVSRLVPRDDQPGALEARAFGRRLALRSPPLCPEIALWLIDESVDLEAACGALADGDAPPYWAFCWGAGQALARYVLDHPDEVAGREVVDLGAGSGVAGIAAALAGAGSVLCVDIDPVARDAVAANAAANAVAPRVASAAELPDRWDVLIASDVIYEHHAARRVDAARGAARCTLVAEPHRPGNPGFPTKPVARYDVCTFPDVDSPTTAASVYRLD